MQEMTSEINKMKRQSSLLPLAVDVGTENV